MPSEVWSLLIEASFILAFGVVSGFIIGYAVAFSILALRHWKNRAVFKSLGEDWVFKPILPAFWAGAPCIGLLGGFIDFIKGDTEISNADVLLATFWMAFWGIWMGVVTVMGRFHKPVKKFDAVQKLRPIYRIKIPIEDLSVTFDCLWNTGKYDYLWRGFSNAPWRDVKPSLSKLYRELSSHYHGNRLLSLQRVAILVATIVPIVAIIVTVIMGVVAYLN